MLEGVYTRTALYPLDAMRGQSEQAVPVTANSEHEEPVLDNRRVRTMPGQDEVGADGRKKDSFELSREAEEIRKLQERDQEVRAHEAAHAAVGGAYAGSPTYTFERGADGRSYAVGGEVSIDVSPIAGDPQATLQKAQQVSSAALAPAEPSAQDMKVAQRAQAMAAKARQDLAQQQVEPLQSMGQHFAGEDAGNDGGSLLDSQVDKGSTDSSPATDNFSPGIARLKRIA